MKIKRYYAQVFVEPDAYSAVRGLKKGDALRIMKKGGTTSVFLGEKHIGTVRGKKRPLVSAILEFENETKAYFFNMNEKEGVMLVRVKINDEPYK